MAIQLPQGFRIGSVEPIDKRIVLTKAEMLAINDNTQPAHYFAVCSEDNKLYIYDKSYDLDPTTGRFRLFEAPVSVQDLSSKLPGAIEVTMQDRTQAEKIADAMFDSEHFAINLENKIDIAVSLIQAIDSN